MWKRENEGSGNFHVFTFSHCQKVFIFAPANPKQPCVAGNALKRE